MSLTIIDKTKPTPPLYVYKPVPDFKRTDQRVAYREKQHQMYMEGAYGLSGAQLFYIQECHLKLIDGSLIRPIWRDVDQAIFDEIDRTREEKKSLLIVKRREVGLTSIAANLAHYFARMYKGVTCNITSNSQPQLYKLFTDKIMPSQNSFHPDIRGSYDSREGGSISQTKSNVGMTLAMKSKNEYGEEIVKTSDFFCRETSESDEAASKFSGTRAFYSFIDEAAIHQRLMTLLSSLMPVMMKGSVQEGLLIMGGSIERNIKQQVLIMLKGLIDNAKAYNLNWMFIPGYMGIDEFMVNGWSNVDKATEWILRRREELNKSPDKKLYNAFMKSHPLTMDELFELGGEGFWEESSLQVLNEVKKKLELAPPPITPVTITPVGPELKVTVVRESPITILEHPKENVNYIFGLDSIMSAKNSGDTEGSEFAFIGMKQLDPADEFCKEGEESSYTPVVLYHQRPDRIIDAYKHAMNIIKYYNQHGNNIDRKVKVMLEANAATSDHFATFMDGENMAHFLMNRPDLSGLGHSDTKKKGIYVTVDGMDWLKKQANIIIQKYGYRYKMVDVIYDILKLGAENADIGSALLAAYAGMGNKFDKIQPPPPEPPPHWKRSISNGQHVWLQEKSRLLPTSSEAPEQKFIEFMGIRTPILENK